MPIHYINPDMDYSQDELFDYNPLTEKVIDWKERKVFTEIIAESFRRLGERKTYINLRNCGTDLIFKLYENNDKRLHQANFCRHRLCPMCSWRKSLKKFAQVSQMMAWLEPFNYRYLFVTLTVKNCVGEDLNKTIDALLDGYHNLFRNKDIKKAYKGAFRALEVTYNYQRGDYHPHLHMIVAVNKSYFNNSKIYVKQKKLGDIWKTCLSLNYDPIIYVEKIDDENCNMAHAVAEVAKYTVKGSDLFFPYDLDVQDSVVSTLNEVLRGRRLTSVRGVFNKAQKALKIDLEDTDLVNTDLETVVNPQLEYVLVHYKWSFGDSRYLFDGYIEKENQNDAP